MKRDHRSADELRALIREANRSLGRIEDREVMERNRALLGKCFRYRNCSSGGKPSWWLYAKVTEVRGRNIFTFEFQDMKIFEGTIQIGLRRSYYSHMIGGFQPISVAAFDKAWRALRHRISSQRP